MQQKYISALAIVALFAMMTFTSQNVRAQCKSFVKVGCLPQIAPYIHDGNYQAVMMSEGEEAEVYKTVFAGQQYRLFVCIDDVMPTLEFVVSDVRRNILFDNRKSGNVNIWDFKPEASQQIKITVRIPKSPKEGSAEKEIIFGCVGVLFGFLE